MTTLFEKWLHETDKLQKEAFSNDLAAMNPDKRAAEFRTQAFAVVSELVEMSNEISWKPWASAQFINRDAFISEGVDILHFVANLLLLAGCTDEELNEKYLAKMQVNRDRQAAGYDGVSTKCPVCKRALDDSSVDCEPGICRAGGNN